MALSYVNYTADGLTTQFNVTFGYLSRNHVSVFVDNNLGTYKWISPSLIEITPAPVAGTEVRIQRLTDKVNRITDFSDGQTLLAGDLDAATLQNFYLAQEVLDGLTDGILQGDVILNQPLAPNGDPLTLQQIQTFIDDAANNSPVIQQLLGDVSQNTSDIVAETQARLDAISAEAAARLQGLLDEAAARQLQVDALQSQIDADVLALQGTASDLAQEVTDRTNAVQGNALAIAQEILDRQNGDTTLQTNIDAVVATANNNAALIATEQQARIDGDDALASQIQTIIANSAGVATYWQPNAPLTANDGDLWFDTDDGNRIYVWDTGAWQLARDSDIDLALSQITTEQTARASGDTALASDITALTARVDTNEADIITVNTAISDETSARATAISGLQTQVDANAASIVVNATAISDETSARASEVAALTARFGDAASPDTFRRTASLDGLWAGTTESALNPASWATFADPLQGEVIYADFAGAGGLQAVLPTRLPLTPEGVYAASASLRNYIVTADPGDDAFVGLLVLDEDLVSVGTRNEFVYDLASLWTTVETSEFTGASLLSSFPTGKWVMMRVGAARAGSDRTGIAWMRLEDRGANAALQANVEAQIASEASVRASETAANASDITALTTRVGDAEAAIVTNATAISTETSARTTAISALQTQVDANAASIIVNATAISDETSARTSALAALQAQVDGNAASILTNQTAIATETAARTSALTALQAEVDSNTADVASNQTAIATETAARATAISGLQTQVDDNAAAIVSEQTARASGDATIATDLSALTTRVGDAEADIVTNSTAISTEEAARAADTKAIRATFGYPATEAYATASGSSLEAFHDRGPAQASGPREEISPVLRWSIHTDPTEGIVALSDGSSANGGQALAIRQVVPFEPDTTYRMEVRVAAYLDDPNQSPSNTLLQVWYYDSSLNYLGAQSTFISPQLSVADGWQTITWERTSAQILAAQPNTAFIQASVTVDRGSAGVARSMCSYVKLINARDEEYADAIVLTEQNARVSADDAIASDLTALTTRVGDAEVAITNEQTARASGDAAIASDVTSLGVRMDTAEANITTNAGVSADALGRATAMYSVRIDANGYVSGFGLSNDGAESEFAILADRFLIARPGAPASAQGLFLIDGSNVYLQNAFIANLNAGVITTGEFSADRLASDVLEARHIKADEAWIDRVYIGADAKLSLDGSTGAIYMRPGSYKLFEMGNLDGGKKGLRLRQADGTIVAEFTDTGTFLEAAVIQNLTVDWGDITNVSISSADIGTATIETLNVSAGAISSVVTASTAQHEVWSNFSGPGQTAVDGPGAMSGTAVITNDFTISADLTSFEPGGRVQVAVDFAERYPPDIFDWMYYIWEVYRVPLGDPIPAIGNDADLIYRFEGQQGNSIDHGVFSGFVVTQKRYATYQRTFSTTDTLPGGASSGYTYWFRWRPDETLYAGQTGSSSNGFELLRSSVHVDWVNHYSNAVGSAFTLNDIELSLTHLKR